jgi:hypothetical protein
MQACDEYHRVRRCVHANKSRMKDMHDGKSVHDHLYSEGDLVWFNVQNLSLRHASRRHKLLPKFWGPLKIIELVGQNAARLDLPSHLKHVHPVVSVSLLKPFKQRAGSAPPPVFVDGELQYELDCITDNNLVTSRRKTVPPIVEFRVRWKGACDDTWHEPSDFEHAQHALNEFLQKVPKRERTSVVKAFDAASFARMPSALQSLTS